MLKIKKPIFYEVYIEDYLFMLSMINLGYANKKSLVLLKTIANKKKLKAYLYARIKNKIDNINDHIDRINSNKAIIYCDPYVKTLLYNRSKRNFKLLEGQEFFLNENDYKIYKKANVKLDLPSDDYDSSDEEYYQNQYENHVFEY